MSKSVGFSFDNMFDKEQMVKQKIAPFEKRVEKIKKTLKTENNYLDCWKALASVQRGKTVGAISDLKNSATSLSSRAEFATNSAFSKKSATFAGDAGNDSIIRPTINETGTNTVNIGRTKCSVTQVADCGNFVSKPFPDNYVDVVGRDVVIMYQTAADIAADIAANNPGATFTDLTVNIAINSTLTQIKDALRDALKVDGINVELISKGNGTSCFVFQYRETGLGELYADTGFAHGEFFGAMGFNPLINSQYTIGKQAKVTLFDNGGGGVEVISNSNFIKNLKPGIDATLTTIGDGYLQIEEDADQVQGAVLSFVQKINDMFDVFASGHVEYSASKKNRVEITKDGLGRNLEFRRMESAFIDTINSSFGSGRIKTWDDLGFLLVLMPEVKPKLDDDGKVIEEGTPSKWELTLADRQKFDSALMNELSSVKKFFGQSIVSAVNIDDPAQPLANQIILSRVDLDIRNATMCIRTSSTGGNVTGVSYSLDRVTYTNLVLPPIADGYYYLKVPGATIMVAAATTAPNGNENTELSISSGAADTLLSYEKLWTEAVDRESLELNANIKQHNEALSNAEERLDKKKQELERLKGTLKILEIQTNTMIDFLKALASS